MTPSAHELKWKIHARTAAFRREVDRAAGLIRLARATGEHFVISWSGGKDSTSMALLVKEVWPECPLMTQFDDCDWPEKRPYIERVCKVQGWQLNEVLPGFSVWDIASKADLGVEELCRLDHDLTQDSFIKPLESKRIALGCAGTFIGLRAAESRARKMNIITRTALYQKAGVWKCLPLARFETIDAFALIVSRGCEINPCYFHNAVRAPEDIRLSWALPTPTGTRHGDMEHIRRHYPAQFRRVRELTHV